MEYGIVNLNLIPVRKKNNASEEKPTPLWLAQLIMGLVKLYQISFSNTRKLKKVFNVDIILLIVKLVFMPCVV